MHRCLKESACLFNCSFGGSIEQHPHHIQTHTALSAMTCSDEHSHSMRLPAELRDRIYELALVSDEQFEIDVKYSRNDRRKYVRTIRPPVEPPLLRVSRQIRDEALPVHYGNNIFCGMDKVGFGVWLQRLGPQKRSLLRHLRSFKLSFSNVHSAKLCCAVMEAYFKEQGAGISPGTLLIEVDAMYDPDMAANVRGLLPGENCPEDLRLWVDSSTATILVTDVKSPAHVLKTLQGYLVDGYFKVNWQAPAADGESHAGTEQIILDECEGGWANCIGCNRCV